MIHIILIEAHLESEIMHCNKHAILSQNKIWFRIVGEKICRQIISYESK